MRQRFGIGLGLTAALATVDLVVQSSVRGNPGLAHHRSVAWMVLSFGILAVVLGSAVLPSRPLAASAGVLGGGLAGNLGSALIHHRVIPNPFVAGDIAFNLADAFVVLGLVGGGVALMRLAQCYRHLLPRHTIPVRITRYVATRIKVEEEAP
jgi:lipoprotein signal peptidase